MSGGCRDRLPQVLADDVPEPRHREESNSVAEDGFDELETVPTSRADLESAGRSCMAIVVIIALILLLLVAWFALHALGMAG
jgi:hypothetical protein